MLSALNDSYQALKLVLVDTLDVSKDTLHVYVGMAIYLTLRAPLRRGRLLAWSLVLVAALAGEFLDYRGEIMRQVRVAPSAHWHDIINTLFWPTLLALAEPWFARPRAGSGENGERALEQP